MTSTNHNTDTTTEPVTTSTSTLIQDYNEFPTNGFTEMPVGVKIYTDNSEKSKEINKQLLNNYIERYQHDSKVILCKVTYVDDVIRENITNMVYDYDSHNGDQLYLRDHYCTIIYTITSKGSIVINENIDTTTSPATTLTTTNHSTGTTTSPASTITTTNHSTGTTTERITTSTSSSSSTTTSHSTGTTTSPASTITTTNHSTDTTTSPATTLTITPIL